MTKEEAQEIVNGWNGKDERFMVNGELYTEQDVQEAEEVIDDQTI